MPLSSLGQEIIVMHLSPLLSQSDIHSLLATEKALYDQLHHLRFQTTEVLTSQGFIAEFLTPASLQTIRHLVFNGTEEHHDRVLSSPNFNDVIYATIVEPITVNQRVAFGQWMQRLTSLTENEDPEDDDRESSSFSHLPAGSIKNLRVLILGFAIPRKFGTLLSMAEKLTVIKYQPEYDPLVIEEYERFGRSFKELLSLLGDRKMLPNLRFVHAAPDPATLPELLPIRASLLPPIWAAVISHGGWLLVAQKPETYIEFDFAQASENWWSDRAWDFFITIEEFEEFATTCQSHGIYPRLDQFILGNVHIKILGDTAPYGKLMDTNVYAVHICHNRSTDVTAALRIVTRNTKALAITLEEYSCGWICTNHPNPHPFQSLEALMIEGPLADPAHDPQPYSKNISAALVKTLAVGAWRNLVHLSLPACAFEKAPIDGVRSEMDFAACGRHIGAYDFKWLADCQALKVMQLLEWEGCQDCRLEEDVSLEGGLWYLPDSVSFLMITGYLSCPEDLKEDWADFVHDALEEGLSGQREDLVVNISRLYIGV